MTAFISYINEKEDPKDSDLEEAEPGQKFHDEYLSSIFENNVEDK